MYILFSYKYAYVFRGERSRGILYKHNPRTRYDVRTIRVYIYIYILTGGFIALKSDSKPKNRKKLTAIPSDKF